MISQLTCRQYIRVSWRFSFSTIVKPSQNESPVSHRKESRGPRISWYPGHIAKAEKELAEYIKKVDVVVEVRDSRIPLSTAHPLVSKWIGNRPHLIAMMRTDQATHKSQLDWKSFFSSKHNTSGGKVYFVEGKLGRGIDVLKKHILREGIEINAKRKRMGIMTGRPVRAAVIGDPNVGKSSLINRLLKKKLARVRNVAGHTRSMHWVRLGSAAESGGNSIELLDSPGIIPAKHVDQYSAMSLAICNDIGQAAYENENAAMALFDRVLQISKERRGYVNLPKILARYELELYEGINGEDIVRDIADKLYNSSLKQAADKVLGDFRRGYWGCITLEAPPTATRNETLGAESDIDDEEGSTLWGDGVDDPTESLDIAQDENEIANRSCALEVEELVGIVRGGKEKRGDVKRGEGMGQYDGW